mgnify:CR=1 FL=1
MLRQRGGSDRSLPIKSPVTVCQLLGLTLLRQLLGRLITLMLDMLPARLLSNAENLSSVSLSKIS